MSIYIWEKHGYLENRDYSNSERLERSRNQIEFMRRYLDQLENKTNHCSDKVSEDNLLYFAKSIDQALRAMENAVFFGETGYTPVPIHNYSYIDD